MVILNLSVSKVRSNITKTKLHRFSTTTVNLRPKLKPSISLMPFFNSMSPFYNALKFPITYFIIISKFWENIKNDYTKSILFVWWQYILWCLCSQLRLLKQTMVTIFTLFACLSLMTLYRISIWDPFNFTKLLIVPFLSLMCSESTIS